ncbi:hypothetical protein QCE63_14630 [Caballeronia sp. LZ065]|uniref:hypothetical protein n=1 Tax=Caballeronia sp. LZ065 TaxID=3038571 RepID=UPI00285DE09F|nr:hypothetical protein [Caballeronia sp. LZ065]MDR5780656.1 hypothetical protein [Caballeronia sp. LZ065]
MDQTRFVYRGFVITPMAAYDGGLYAAMVIICDDRGQQRASGVLGHFDSPEQASAFALTAGTDEVDRRLWHPVAA